MAIGFLHNYEPGGLIDSSDWNDELNQIFALLGASIVTNPNQGTQISGQTDSINEPILKLDNLLTGNILELTNISRLSFIKNDGQINLDANAIVAFLVESVIKCPNLNADLLNGKHSTDLETKIFSHHCYTTFWSASDILLEKEFFFVSANGFIVTKLKAKHEGGASADAITIFDVQRNGISIGTITLTANDTTVQVNNIADVTLNTGDFLAVILNTYSGTTKHVNCTVSVEYKNRYNG